MKLNKVGKFKAQTRNIMRWERKQAKQNRDKGWCRGFDYGAVVGALAVAAVFYFLSKFYG